MTKRSELQNINLERLILIEDLIRDLKVLLENEDIRENDIIQVIFDLENLLTQRELLFILRGLNYSSADSLSFFNNAVSSNVIVLSKEKSSNPDPDLWQLNPNLEN